MRHRLLYALLCRLALILPLLTYRCELAAAGSDDPPELQLHFSAEETVRLTEHGHVDRAAEGPRPPDYPDFEPDNTAIRFFGDGGRLVPADDEHSGLLTFTNGDAITIEAWVQVSELGAGRNAYVIGKGRTHRKGYPADNQNWALRVRESKGRAAVSFLFATKKTESSGSSHWHRWTTKEGFRPGPVWHHIAVTYRFGEPDSVRGWIDGNPAQGSWDMGGPTNEAPVTDDDEVWIGSSMGGNSSATLTGGIDDVMVHRSVVPDDVLKNRYRFTGEDLSDQPSPEIAPQITDLHDGQIMLSIHESLPSHDRWLLHGEKFRDASAVVSLPAAVLDRLPQRYDNHGIRESWRAPTLIRLASRLRLTPGDRRVLVRARGLSRLWFNGTVIARTSPLTGSPSGEEPMTPVAGPPAPGLRRAEHRQQEVIVPITIPASGECLLVLEAVVGGSRFRTDPGETLIAVETEDGKSWLLPMASPVGGSGEFAELTDAEVIAALASVEEELTAFDTLNRRQATQAHDSVWELRHRLAGTIIRAPEIPAAVSAPSHPIDRFLTARITAARSQSGNSAAPSEAAGIFRDQVEPIFRSRCIRCHGGDAAGGLNLTNRDSLRLGGDSGLSLLPGDTVPADVEERAHPDGSHQGELLRRLRSTDEDERMPPGPSALTDEEISVIAQWISAGAAWPAPAAPTEEEMQPAPLSDEQFARRVFLDTVGVLPSPSELHAFLEQSESNRRETLIDRLLADPRWADHQMGYWQDVLAENPTIVNASLNTSGPFRWFLHESFRDGKSFDRLVTDLVLLRGSAHEGGSAGFGLAGDNDSPRAAKAQVLASAFLGMELQCARCHDAPYHNATQQDLYALAAMLENKPLRVPESSRVPAEFFENKERRPLIRVSLRADQPVSPDWPFDFVLAGNAAVENRPEPPAEAMTAIAELSAAMKSPREQLAFALTGPHNTRFPEVIVNRIWRRLLGAGIVEPPDDWERSIPSHPELLAWLAADFVEHGYSLRHTMKRIMTSGVYQRRATGRNRDAPADQRWFVHPDRRRMTAEQIVDTLYAAAGTSMQLEELTFDPDGRRASSNRLTLGFPSRAWMLANLANERDRPSLGLPKARAVADLMEAFGWSGARQSPRTDRESEPNVLQPGVMANSVFCSWVTRATADSGIADAAVAAESPEHLVKDLYQRYLSRNPTPDEARPLVRLLNDGFEQRLSRPADDSADETDTAVETDEPLPRVTWSNHLRSEANRIALEMELRARRGPTADPRLADDWRERYEDVVWSIINTPEFIWIP